MTLVHGIESVGVNMIETTFMSVVSDVLVEDAQTTISEDAGATAVEPQPEPGLVPDYPAPNPYSEPWYGPNDGAAPYGAYEVQEPECDCGCEHCDDDASGLLIYTMPILMLLLVILWFNR